MNQILNEANVSFQGHLKIFGYDNGSDVPVVLVDKSNAVHKEHVSLLFARAIAGKQNGMISSIHFGTGGSSTDNNGNISYQTPNVTGNADLYNETYSLDISPTASNVDISDRANVVSVRHTGGEEYTDVDVNAFIDRLNPPGQPRNDIVSEQNADFQFDELGLKTENGLLLSHVVFAPILKSANREIRIVYTLRINIG